MHMFFSYLCGNGSDTSLVPDNRKSGYQLHNVAGSIYGSVDPRGGSRTNLLCVPRSPPSVGIGVWIPEVALVQI